MKRSLTIPYCFCLLILGLLTACQAEPQKEPDSITGYWEIKEAYRNGQQTESLDELFFEFFADGTMRTNISSFPANASYELKGNRIMQREGEMDIDYAIEQVSDSTLTLTTNIRNFNFRFDLVKRNPQE